MVCILKWKPDKQCGSKWRFWIAVAGVLIGGIVGGIMSCLLADEWSFSVFASGFVVGAGTTAGAFAGPVVGAIVGGILNGLAVALQGGTRRQIFAAIGFGAISGAAGGFLGLAEGVVLQALMGSAVIGMLCSDSQSWATAFD